MLKYHQHHCMEKSYVIKSFYFASFLPKFVKRLFFYCTEPICFSYVECIPVGGTVTPFIFDCRKRKVVLFVYPSLCSLPGSRTYYYIGVIQVYALSSQSHNNRSPAPLTTVGSRQWINRHILTCAW